MDAVADDWRREMPEHDSPELELIMRVGRLAQLLEEALSECLIPWNLTKADYGVLRSLRTSGAPYELRPTDICNRLLLTSGGVSNVINRLERLRLAERIPDRSDGRSSWVRLTGAGTEVAEDTMRAWAAAQGEMFSGVDPPLARRAADTLREVLLALGDREPAAPATRKAEHERSRRP